MSHTPGPWTARIGFGEWLVGTESYVTADCGRTTIGASEDNARLIAAAPDLLAALQALADADLLHSRLDDGPKKMHATAIARAAIAKATGADK